MKIMVVTGSRADYGLLEPVIEKLKTEHIVVLVATGTQVGNGDINVETLLVSNTELGVTKSMGLGVSGFGQVFSMVTPDWLLVLGDRYEVFSACVAATVHRIPIIHIGGGDTTEGSYDESFRHCITKMSHLHFVTNQQAFDRVKQLGEENIHLVGSPGLDNISGLKYLNDNYYVPRNSVMVIYHPTTLEEEENVIELVNAVNSRIEGRTFIVSSNADNGSNKIDIELGKIYDRIFFNNLPRLNFLALLSEMSMIIGNSSAGLHEAPSLGVPTINIGDRQKGRLSGGSVVHCRLDYKEIVKAIDYLTNNTELDYTNPYSEGNASQKMLEIIRNYPEPKKLLKKRFIKCPE